MTDFSRAAKNATRTSLDLAIHLGAELVLLHSYHLPQVIFAEPPEMTYAEIEQKSSILLEKEKETLLAEADHKKVKIRILTVNTIGPLSEVLFDIQQSGEVILAVMGRHKRHRSNFLFSNHIHVALRNSNCPLLIVSNHGFRASRCNINFASDLNEKDLLLLKSIEQLRNVFKANISLSYVMGSRGFISDFNEEYNIAAFQRTLQADEFRKINFRVLEGNSIAIEVERVSGRSSSDLLVIVNRKHLLLHELLHKSHCKVFIEKHNGAILIIPEDWVPKCR